MWMMIGKKKTLPSLLLLFCATSTTSVANWHNPWPKKKNLAFFFFKSTYTLSYESFSSHILLHTHCRPSEGKERAVGNSVHPPSPSPSPSLHRVRCTHTPLPSEAFLPPPPPEGLFIASQTREKGLKEREREKKKKLESFFFFFEGGGLPPSREGEVFCFFF